VYVPQNVLAPDVVPTVSHAGAPARPAYAGFWLRAVACFIDTVLIMAVFLLGASFFPATFEKLLPPTPVSLADMPQPSPIVILILVSVGCLYYTLFEASGWQATPGKRIMRIYVTDLHGRRISLGRSFLRNIARQLSGIFFIGYLITRFTEKKQALHDILAGCLVLRR